MNDRKLSSYTSALEPSQECPIEAASYDKAMASAETSSLICAERCRSGVLCSDLALILAIFAKPCQKVEGDLRGLRR
jgi:hypothetical protein